MGVDALDQAIASNPDPTSSLITTDEWTLDKYLYQKLDENPSLIDSSSLLQSFYNDSSSENMAVFSTMENKMNGVSALIANHESTRLANDSVIDTLRIQQITNDSLIGTSTDSIFIAGMQQENADIQNSIN